MKKIPVILLAYFCCLRAVAAEPATVSGTTEPIVRIARISVDPDRLDEYNAFLKEEIEVSMTLEPGVVLIYAVSDKDAPANLTLLEIYRNQKAYLIHIQTPHFIKYKESTADMVLSLELVDVVPLIPEILSRIAY